MDLSAPISFQDLLSHSIQKNIQIFGPTVVFAKLKNIPGLEVDMHGIVKKMTGNPHDITQQCITQFMQLSSFVAKKTLEPLIAYDSKELSDQAKQTPLVI